MSLGSKQREFNRCLGLLYIYIYSSGYEVTQGRGRVSETANAAEGGHANSCHLYGLAQDLNLFLNGEFLTNTVDHEKFGIYWESLHPQARWGGRFNDGNHYSFEHNGVK